MATDRPLVPGGSREILIVGTAAASGARGLGLRIADRLVLTAASMIRPDPAGDATPWVAKRGTERRYACRPAWLPESSLAGAAVLEIVDDGWRSASEPLAVRWGVLAGRGVWTPGLVPGGVDSAVLAVAVNPLAFASDQRLQLRLDPVSVPQAAADRYPDGAPLICHELIAGVTMWEETADGQRRLTAVPAAPIVLDPRFRELVGQAAGVPPQPEPVELASLLDPWRPSAPPRTPADLLRPEYAAVPFQGCRGTLADLEVWCRNGTMVSAALLTGSAGQGKTRVARHLAEALCQQGWVVGMLVETPPTGWLDAVGATDKPLLLVVEHAIGRTAQVATLVRWLAERPTGHPVRVLLLADAVDHWWPRLAAALGDLAVAVAPEPVTLPELTPEARRAEFERAVAAFAGQLPALTYGSGPPAAPARDLDLPVSLRSTGSVLEVHMAALAGLLEQCPDNPGAAQTILAAESRAWDRLASRLPPEARSSGRRAMTAALLCGAEHRSQAVELLTSLEGRDRGATNARVLAEWVQAVLPPPDIRRAFWGTLRPDRLRAHYLATEAPELDLLSALLPTLPDRLIEVALTRLAEAAAVDTSVGRGDPERPLLRRLAALIADNPAVLGPAAVRAVARAGPGSPLVAVLERLPETHIDMAECEQLVAAIPEPPGPLAALAVRLYERIIEHHRATAPGSGAGSAALGAALVASSGPLVELGQVTAAADRTAEAVAVYRTAAGTVPPAIARPRLVAALRVHAGRLTGAGRADAALAALADARAECERLPEGEASPQLAELAEAMVSLARRRLAAGQPALAADPAQRAVDIRRSLIGRREPEQEPGLYVALDTLGQAWLAVDALTLALTALEESAVVCRRLAHSRGGVYLPRLGTTLDRLSEVLFLVGRQRAAAAVSEEAVAVHRRFAEQWPVRRSALAAASRTLSSRLAAAGRHEQALAAADEAIAYHQELAARDGQRFAVAMADASHTRAVRLSELGQWRAAVATGTDAVTAYRRLAGGGAQPSPELAASLNNLSVMLSEDGLASQSLGVGRQAIDIYQRLVDRGEAGCVAHLAVALTNQAVQLAQVSRPAESAAAAEQAVALYQRAPAAGAARFRDAHAVALGVLTRHRLAHGRIADGQQAAERGVALLRELAGEDPDRYLAHYAAALLDLGDGLAAHEHWEAAAGATALAAQAHRELLVRYPAAARGPLSSALRLLSQRLAADGRAEQAVIVAEERVVLHRGAGGELRTPDLEALADALDDLGTQQAAGGWYDRAAAATRDSLAVREQLSVSDPRIHLPRLAASWRALSRYLATHDPVTAGGDDLAAAVAAVESSRRLVAVDLDEFLRQLAPSMRLLAQRQAAAGHRVAATDTAAEAADHYARLAELTPARFRPELAAVLADLTTLLADAGRLPQSLESADRAVETWRRLAADDPQHRGQLAQALTVLSSQSSKLELLERAFTAAVQAANIYGELAAEQPDRFAERRAAALLQVAGTGRPWRDRAGRRDAARAAVQLYERLADGWPGRFDQELVSARAMLPRGRPRWLARRPATEHEQATTVGHE